MLFYDVTFRVEKIKSLQDGSADNQEAKDEKRKALLKLLRSSLDYRNGGAFFVVYHLDDETLSAVLGAEPEKASVPSLLEMAKKDIAEITDTENPKEIAVAEITIHKVLQILNKLEDEIGYTRHNRIENLTRNIDFLDPNYKAEEELPELKHLSLKKALERADVLLADDVMKEELKRIYDTQNARTYRGHPVHYLIRAKSREAAKQMIQLLMHALYQNKRLISRRRIYLWDIRECCYEENDVERLFSLSRDTVIALETKGRDFEESDFATGYTRVTDWFESQIRKHRERTLFFIVEHPDYPGFSPQLLSCLTREMDFIAIGEGSGNKEQALRFSNELIMDSDFRDADTKDFEMFLPDKKQFIATDVYSAFEKWKADCMKTQYYPVYRKCRFIEKKEAKSKGDAYQQLDKMVGLAEIKNILKQVIAVNRVSAMRRNWSIHTKELSRHMLFTGNPGTAKTTVARLLAQILKKEGVLTGGHIVECGRSDLVGKYVGWTAPAVKRKFQEAKGGILFIDEAYSLVEKDGLYGDEAINTIVQEMENHREETIVIFAGYRGRMEQFLDKNEGLRSRIAFHIDFPDYDADELTEIFSLMAHDQGYEFSEEVLQRAHACFAEAALLPDFGNGRYVRNFFEKAQLRQSERLLKENTGKRLTKRMLKQMEPEDILPVVTAANRRTRVIGF